MGKQLKHSLSQWQTNGITCISLGDWTGKSLGMEWNFKSASTQGTAPPPPLLRCLERFPDSAEPACFIRGRYQNFRSVSIGKSCHMAPGLEADSQTQMEKTPQQKELVRAPGVKSQTGKLVAFFSRGSAAFTWIWRPRGNRRALHFVDRVREGRPALLDTV